MNHPPLRRFLGLEENADDRALLGMDDSVELSAESITEALTIRLSYIERHPGNTSPAAAVVRRRLGEAAGRLMTSSAGVLDIEVPVAPAAIRKAQAPAPVETVDSTQKSTVVNPVRQRAPKSVKTPANPTSVSPTRPGEGSVAQLTEFDRTVLAILVGSGGWNAASRGRLIGLAAQRGLKPKALMRIVSGLSQLLHGGGFESIAGTDRPISVAAPMTKAPPTPTRLEMTMNQVAEALATEFRAETSGARSRVVAYFSIAALLVIAFFAIALSLPSPAAERARALQEQQEALDKARVAAALEEQQAAEAAQAGMSVFGSAIEDPTRAIDLVPQKTWGTPPNFQADARPRAEILRAHDAPQWVVPLEGIARKGSLPQSGNSATVRREYGVFVRDSGRCWPFLEPIMRSQIIDLLTEPIATAGTPELRNDFIARLGEDLDRMDHPLDIWRASWAAGVLGSVAAGVHQPEAARMAAKEVLMLDLGVRRRMRESTGQPFDSSAGRKLDVMTPLLVALTIETPTEAYEYWEYWIEAQRAVRRGASLDAAWLDAVDALLRQSDGLEGHGPSMNVLGRLVSELEFTARAHDPELVRANLLSWFEDDSISSVNLWVLSSMLAQSIDVPWWDATFVVAPTASLNDRRWYADLVDESWPQLMASDRPRGIPVPLEALERATRIIEALKALPIPTEDGPALYRFLTWAQVTGAVEALELGDVDRALQEIRDSELMLETPYTSLGYPIDLAESVGQASGVDGAWTEDWVRIRRDQGAREAGLRYLKQRSGGDLGPVDAATLANEALRGTPREIRLLAQETILENFSFGPNVVLALVNAFEFAPRNQDTVEFISRMIGADLPALSDDGWRVAARHAMLRHALSLRRTDMHDIDRLAGEYRSLLQDRLDLAGGDPYLIRRNAAELMALRVDIEAARAKGQYVANPIPATIDELDRRRSVRWTSANGEPQQLVAELSALADLAIYRTAGMRPDLSRSLRDRHRELTSRVSVASNVLEQLILLEEMIAEVALMRLEAEGGFAG